MVPIERPSDDDFSIVRVLPFIGRDYGRVMPWGVPIFVLGESHYRGDRQPLTREFTRETVQGMLDGKTSYSFFTKAVGAFFGRCPSHEERQSFWRATVFYNFIQDSVGDKARIRPTDEMWRNAGPALEEALMLFMPGFVLVLGKQLWDNLPVPMQEGPIVQHEDGSVRGSRLYFNDNGCAFAFGISHPSSRGWKYTTWTPWVKAALAEAVRFQQR